MRKILLRILVWIVRRCATKNISLTQLLDSINKVIIVDFDGTIAKTTNFPYIDKPMPHAKEALFKLKQAGYKIVISSCRNNIALTTENVTKCMKYMKFFLDKNHIPYDEIDYGFYGKPLGRYYIDDKGIAFRNNWLKIVDCILKKDKKDAKKD